MMKVKTTLFKKDLYRVLKTLLPDAYSFQDSEVKIDETKTPMVCLSSDSGTGYKKSEYGLMQGITNVMVDVYLAAGKDFEKISQTDLLQEKIRRAIISDPEIKKNYSNVEVKNSGAVSLPGESCLRILTHDIEVTWTETEEGLDD